jgi:hypothetical protein
MNTWKFDSAQLRELYKRSLKNSSNSNNRDLTPQDITAPTTHVAILANTKHSNFCDVPLMSPLVTRKVKAIGTQDWKRASELFHDLSIDFLNDCNERSSIDAFKRLHKWKESDAFRWLEHYDSASS